MNAGRRFSVVLFDLGSTLLYFDAPMAEVMIRADQRLVEALGKMGYDLDPAFIPEFRAGLRDYFRQRDVDFLEFTVERVLSTTLATFGYPGVPKACLKDALRAMYAIFQAHWKLESDSLPVLAELRRQDYRMGLVSNAGDAEDVRVMLANHGLEPWFEQILISAEVGYRKPHPRIFQLALDFFRTPPGQVVMVGDKLGADVLGARNAGMASVWITRRAHRSDNLAHENTIQPDAVIAALDELPSLLANWDHHASPEIDPSRSG